MLDELLYQLDKEADNVDQLEVPRYDPSRHVGDLARNRYWHMVLLLRHAVRLISDNFFSYKRSGINVDLFMMTPSVSSPMGPGSDSEAIPIKFGNLETFLVDSSQFGFEPIIMNDFPLLYCYLPSMRGEDPDRRHLNQFFHCEAEMQGSLDDVMALVESYVLNMTKQCLLLPNIISCLSRDAECSMDALQEMAKNSSFPRIRFDEAVQILELLDDAGSYTRTTEHGRDITSIGELKLAQHLGIKVPFWITHYDRDRVPFYQKPDPVDTSKVLNADLIFPPLMKDSFGGEVVGCGQRQDSKVEMKESLSRQGLSTDPYEWYIGLRELDNYKTTSGFGIGIERYLAWLLCGSDIKDFIPYPRLKNIVTHP